MYNTPKTDSKRNPFADLEAKDAAEFNGRTVEQQDDTIARAILYFAATNPGRFTGMSTEEQEAKIRQMKPDLILHAATKGPAAMAEAEARDHNNNLKKWFFDQCHSSPYDIKITNAEDLNKLIEFISLYYHDSPGLYLITMGRTVLTIDTNDENNAPKILEVIQLFDKIGGPAWIEVKENQHNKALRERLRIL